VVVVTDHGGVLFRRWRRSAWLMVVGYFEQAQVREGCTSMADDDRTMEFSVVPQTVMVREEEELTVASDVTDGGRATVAAADMVMVGKEKN